MRRRSRLPLRLLAGAGLLAAGAGFGAALGRGQGDDGASPAVQRSTAAAADSEARRERHRRAPAPKLCGALRTTQAGRIQDAALTELSGLVRSRLAPGSFWAIEDSGAAAVLHRIGPRGEQRGSALIENAENVDWEDLAAAGRYLYAADIGDNNGVRESVAVYRAEEPATPAPVAGRRLTLRYDGGARDAEALLVDPWDGTLVVVTKGLVGGDVFTAKPPAGFGGERTVRERGGVGLSLVTGGDVSADGRTIALRTYGSLAVWQRRRGESIAEALKRKPCVSPTSLRDGQGEALALSASGAAAWTVAERNHAPLLRRAPR